MLWGWVSEGVFGDIELVEKELVEKELFLGVGAGGWVLVDGCICFGTKEKRYEI